MPVPNQSRLIYYGYIAIVKRGIKAAVITDRLARLVPLSSRRSARRRPDLLAAAVADVALSFQSFFLF